MPVPGKAAPAGSIAVISVVPEWIFSFVLFFIVFVLFLVLVFVLIFVIVTVIVSRQSSGPDGNYYVGLGSRLTGSG
ncbi:hypothetical protein F1C58_16240 (plasmid) [Glaciihabitans sp. INWT7]|uniref:hypothetical protein n=1 Tax=Glaciihabitans sp. INWT7 TaxID=2596912 RepID=UPI0016231897|nr:hypothetical protein [Glaciihabitans sp. INWT7]QNE48609.1 hypothetical protein F1C58_16240 [Glaciihabitans sp. INWT7]